MTHTIHIHKLGVSALMGCTGDERNLEQPLFVDMWYTYDATEATKKDDQTLTVDYDAVSLQVERYLKSKKHILLESAAQGIVEHLLEFFPISHVKVAVEKIFAIKKARSAIALYEGLK